MVAVRVFADEFPRPIETLERRFRDGGISLVQAVFENTFFVSPDQVRTRSPYFPGFARKSREHYPGLDPRSAAQWQGQPIRLDANSRAQQAWAKYSGRPIERSTGYGVRHIWGHPWDPAAFTAGWNLAYMPFWAGMLTEDQHPHPDVQAAIKQAGWELFFRNDPVCDPPDFVTDPGVHLTSLLGDQPLLVAAPRPAKSRMPPSVARADAVRGDDSLWQVQGIRRQVGNSWSNLQKAARSLQGLGHQPFSTRNVESNSKSHIRRMVRDTGLELAELSRMIDDLAAPHDS